MADTGRLERTHQPKMLQLVVDSLNRRMELLVGVPQDMLPLQTCQDNEIEVVLTLNNKVPLRLGALKDIHRPSVSGLVHLFTETGVRVNDIGDFPPSVTVPRLKKPQSLSSHNDPSL